MSVRVEKSGRVTTVILSRIKRRNAVDRETADALTAAFEAFDHDEDSGAKAVRSAPGPTFALSPKGDRIASSPGDRGPWGRPAWSSRSPSWPPLQGMPSRGGLELALWCDLRVVEDDATFGVFCRRWGVPLIDGGTVRLPRIVGISRALDMILTGRAVGAREALAWGLANRVVPSGCARADAGVVQTCSARMARIVRDWRIPLPAPRRTPRAHLGAGQPGGRSREHRNGVRRGRGGGEGHQNRAEPARRADTTDSHAALEDAARTRECDGTSCSLARRGGRQQEGGPPEGASEIGEARSASPTRRHRDDDASEFPLAERQRYHVGGPRTYAGRTHPSSSGARARLHDDRVRQGRGGSARQVRDAVRAAAVWPK